ncbi:MAG: LacI family transcriptional regulator [Symbiobacteriaceae bacterium]|jgi:ribose transport system substrate-binding protein|nr:LacI family transcriptional regulator [Symbiobacteriaceae bacterium]
MKLSIRTIVRILLALLLGTAAFGLFNNIFGVIGRPLLAGATQVVDTGETLRFVIVAPQYDHPYWEQVRRGAVAMGAKVGVHVDFYGPRRASIDEQAQLLDQATMAQVDGIITQGVHDPQIDQAIDKAVNRGIPVITVDTDSPGPRLAYVGSDNYTAGQRAAQDLLKRLTGPAVIGIIRGNLGPEQADDRVRGFRDALADVPDVRIAAVETSDLTRTAAGQQALKIRQEHPDVNVFYGTTALDAVGVVQSLTTEGMEGRLMVIGWDDVGEAAELAGRGFIDSVVHQVPEEMGSRAVTLMEAYLRRDLRPQPINFLPVQLRGGVEAK